MTLNMRLFVTGKAFTEDGTLTASGEFSGMSSVVAREAIGTKAVQEGIGRPFVSYRK